MSGKHAEIIAEQGLWILRDIGSTNGTYVNNRRIDRHELVDNDFIKFGSAMVKFKSL
jgi:pSer/pThr/pTyr-binding forkhead associated (FHA) protein